MKTFKTTLNAEQLKDAISLCLADARSKGEKVSTEDFVKGFSYALHYIEENTDKFMIEEER